MKKIVLFLVLICPLAATAAPDGGVVSPTVSKEDAEKIRENINALGGLLGVEKPATSPATTTAEHKTVGDVADRALTLVSGAVANVAASIEKVAPELFRVMVRQQYAKAVADLIPSLAWFFIAIIIGVGIRRWWPKNPDDGDAGEIFWNILHWAVPLACLCIGAICFTLSLSDSIKYLVNPEYYAVRDLVTMVLNPQALQ